MVIFRYVINMVIYANSKYSNLCTINMIIFNYIIKMVNYANNKYGNLCTITNGIKYS